MRHCFDLIFWYEQKRTWTDSYFDITDMFTTQLVCHADTEGPLSKRNRQSCPLSTSLCAHNNMMCRLWRALQQVPPSGNENKYFYLPCRAQSRETERLSGFIFQPRLRNSDAPTKEHQQLNCVHTGGLKIWYVLINYMECAQKYILSLWASVFTYAQSVR
jgi:predicted acyl esterase